MSAQVLRPTRELASVSFVLVLMACGRLAQPHAPDAIAPPRAPTLATPAEPKPAHVVEPEPARVEAPRPQLGDAALIVTDPVLLGELEARGLALHRVLGAPAPAGQALHAGSAIYKDFADLVALDDSVAKWRDPHAGTGFAPSHRLFDIRWLRSTRTRFELIGVVNRMDRMFATPEACGELRLIYRLAYSTSRVSSRLPMTLGLVFSQGLATQSHCQAVASSWLALEQQTDLTTALLAGPLRDLSVAQLKRVETNFQSGRWPSAVRPSLGGHAEYVLRSFNARDGRLVLSTLENTPTQKLDRNGRAALKRWIADNRAQIDSGTALLPAEFLAERSVSVQPHGLSRLANRAFTQIARGIESESEDTLIHSSAGLMRRLDQMTCKGCHASRSLAGFHLLGEDSAATTPLNAIAVALSPHLLSELPWRRGFLEALARGERFPQPRPFADRGTGKGLLGEACGLGDATFASWTCAAGLSCRDRLGDLVGTCAPTQGNAFGDAIESGHMRQDRDALRDSIGSPRVETCSDPSAQLARSKDGFPAGMCHAPCPAFGDQKVDAGNDAICGPVPFGKGTEFDGFTRCLTEHDQPFDRCLADDAHPTWLRRCDRETPCRDDYLCVRVQGAQDRAQNRANQSGACLPPYFLFQVRVDGHFVERD